MGQKLHYRIETWKKLLLDFGKRNRLINFLEGKRNNVKVTSPSYDLLYEWIVSNEKELTFPYARKMQISDDGDEVYETVIKGDLETSKPIADLQKTLKNLRYKANTSIEEQGINTLYLTFGMLKWKESDDSSQILSSPIILVPVRLLIESLTSPYRIALHDDEIVVNPTLSHKLDNDFGIVMPDFDSSHDTPTDYLRSVARLVENKGWTVENSTHLTNLSFLKINMYKDLERNEEKLSNNPVVASIVGESEPVSISDELNHYDHDKNTRPIDCFQVVDADSSQQDAVLLSKKGVSFVLQGPPGTGKSQTITNIIAEAIADGKKILFVSEKMAALQVVYNRLSNVGLADFCFTLHSHKAKKKEILRDLANSINIDRTRVREEALAQLEILDRKRKELNQYQEELHTPASALNLSIFNINGKLAKLSAVPDVIFPIESVDKVSDKDLADRIYLLNEFAKTIGKRSEDYEDNVWRDSNIRVLTNELRHDIDSNVACIIDIINELDTTLNQINDRLGVNITPSINGNDLMMELLEMVSKSPLIPIRWIYDDDITILKEEALLYGNMTKNIVELRNKLFNNYNDSVLSEDGHSIHDVMTSAVDDCLAILPEKDRNKLLDCLNNTIDAIADHIEVISRITNLVKYIANKIDVTPSDSLEALNKFYGLAVLLDKKTSPAKLWFDNKHFKEVCNALDSDRERHDRIKELRNKLLINFNKDFIGFNCDELLSKFTNDYLTISNKLNAELFSFSDASVISSIKNLIGDLEETKGHLSIAQSSTENICRYLGIESPITIESSKNIIEFAGQLCEDIFPAERWFDSIQFAKIKENFPETVNKHKSVYQLRKEILDAFDNDILQIDLYPMLQRFRSDYGNVFKRLFSSGYKQDIAQLKKYSRGGTALSYAEALKYLTLIKDFSDHKRKLSEESYEEHLGSYYNGIDTNWSVLEDVLSKFEGIRSNTKLLSNKVKSLLLNKDIDRDLISAEIERYKSCELFVNITKINESLSKKIDYACNMAICLNDISDLAESLSAFLSSYAEDQQFIESYAKYYCTRSIIEYIDILTCLKEFQDKLKLLEHEESKYHKFSSRYGVYYNGIDTKWDEVEDTINTHKSVIEILHHIPLKLRDSYMESSLPNEEIAEFISIYKEANMGIMYADFKEYLAIVINEKTPVSFIVNTYNKLLSCQNNFKKSYFKLVSLRNAPADYETIEGEAHILADIQSKEKLLEEHKEAILDKYQNYYDGIETDWEKVVEALKFAHEFKEFIDLYSLPRDFVEDICKDVKVVEYCKQKYSELSDLQNNLAKPYAWFTSLFNNPSIFNSYLLKDLATRIEDCAKKKHLLEEWVDYCSNRERCKQVGLDPYIVEVEAKGIDENYIVDAYLKRFYRLWLDAILPLFPAVQNFRGRRQTQTIEEFSRLDEAQFKIAQARVRERALSRIPDFNSITGARDEIAILKRELNKQRRLMPLRKLFMEIPNLITSLRPCFMMSPLSVSVFLEAQSYDFDMVIFDEASQVHTEDAIGAIMRGKQVIIVGDTKQLPPTSFFSTSLGDEDFDIDTDEAEDNDAGAYESILDEAVAVLPERSLRWHYRSRHEHLIAFSNIKIYNSQLITFPSSVENASDTGVEYIYVNNGIYDRGGKKNNIIEAQKVADLVFDHFRKHPKRSLGVVTFSEAQQNAVDAAIRKRRLQDSRYDKYFQEDRDEPFFIKNLENVQGDERDTIIFSIGYAKDSRGIMYMNFGPLSREGGYRRLNVAITRAKYNVKLVGSITPTDIDLDKVSSEGVRLLRSYIEFAQQGISALEREITFNYSLGFDSPFEEAVYDFLSSKGYNVVTQVGCSGFRIDMAVKHPKHNGKFAIGIECDGATYHSSRTARERDRLRQSILEDMGWTIHRIWSTDWIKNQTVEEERLLRAVEKALGNPIGGEEMYCDDPIIEEVIPTIEIEEKIVPSEDYKPGYGFDKYVRAYPLNLCNIDGSFRRNFEIVLDVISIEQPIHFEELCRRVAPLWDRQKVTSVVRDEVRSIFEWYLNDYITEDDNEFVRLKDFTDIKVRIPNEDDDYLRSIQYICDEELQLAMKTIAQHSFGITSDDLFIVTTREFGYKSTGRNIAAALRSAYDDMLERNEVTEIEGKVHVN